MLSLPSLSRRRSSFYSRKPTANQSHGDHGNAGETSWYSLGFVGKVVFGIAKRLTWTTGETPIMEVYCFTTVTGIVVFFIQTEAIQRDYLEENFPKIFI